MRIVTALLTNKAYGFPTRGARRRRRPTILACLHQTANPRASAMQERNYANRADSPGPSATAYVDRDGTVVRAIDPARHAAWSQGDVNAPNIKIPTIAAAVASGVNVNEWVYESIEVSGSGVEPYNDAQFEAVAELVAAASRATGLPVTRDTVVVHADFNSVSRRSCPWPPATREARIRRVIDRANAILPAPAVPTPPPPEDDMQISTYIPGHIATIGGDDVARVRAAPSLSAPILRTIAKGRRERWTVIGWVKGDTAEGSDQWLVRWASGRLEYTHGVNVRVMPADATPHTKADIDAAVAAAVGPLERQLAAAQSRIARARTALG